MNAASLTWPSASGGFFGSGASSTGGISGVGGRVTLAAASDLIGVFPLNGMASNADTVDQYGADQLTFAASQGDYTVSGATTQTYLQNFIGSASPFFQVSTANQLSFNNPNIQFNLFALNGQTVNSYVSANPFDASYSAAVFNNGAVTNTAISSVSSFLAPTVPTVSANLGLDAGGLAGTPSTGLFHLGSIGGPQVVGESSSVGTTGSVAGQITGFSGQSPLGLDHLVTGTSAAGTPALGLGVDTPIATVISGETPAIGLGAVVPGLGSASLNTQAVPLPDLSPAKLLGDTMFMTEGMGIKSMIADPFAHYTHVGPDNQSVPVSVVSSLDAVAHQDVAPVIGGDNILFHSLEGHTSLEFQAANALQLDPFGHALPYGAHVGGQSEGHLA